MDAPSPARIAVAVVIVNYNAGAALVETLRSLAADPQISWDAVVIDNASSDGSIEGLTEVAPWVRVIRNRENVGFARGVNQGLGATTAPLALLLNPDCTIAAGATAKLADVLEQYPDCAIVGPRILDPDGSVQGSARGDPDMFTGLFGRTSALRRLLPGAAASKRNVVEVSAGDAGAPSVVVDWLSGACMLTRRSSLMRVGGFDQRYFLYWEDADLCRRLRNAGMPVRYVPGAVAVHQVGRSSSTARAASIRAFHRSAYIYYTTHVAPGRLNPKRVIARVLLAARCWWLVRRS